MALLESCIVCKKQICVMPGGSYLCDDCNGTNERKRKEKERWHALSIEEKLDELKSRLDSLAEEVWRGPARF